MKKISINGIRGFHYLDDSEENPHTIRINGSNHLFIYGENGTGKSSFFDAIEWALTGDVHYEIQKRNADNSFIFNEFNKDTDSPYVEIQFDNSNKITRKQSNNRNEIIDENNISSSDMEALFIETNRIEKFVADRKDNLWKKFSELLGLDELLNFEIKLQKLKNISEKKCSKIHEDYISLKEEIEKLNDEQNNLISKFQEAFGDNWEDKISSIDLENFRYYFKLEIQKKIFIENYEKQKEYDQLINSNVKKLSEIATNLIDKDIIPLINAASDFFELKGDLSYCPICENEINYTKINSKLIKAKESFMQYNQTKSEIEKLKQKQITTLDTDYKSLKEIILYLKLLDIEDDITIDEFYELIMEKNDLLDKLISQNTSNETKDINTYFDKKSYIEEKMYGLEKLKKELNISLSIKNDTKQVYEKYKTEYVARIKSELDSISATNVTAIYNKINQTENDNIEEIRIEPDVENKTLKFQIKFNESDELIDANKILSTGHLRCLGFALLITRVIKKDLKLEAIFIDDPIYSIDHEHRYYLIKYLQELGQEYQLIILSSDRMFYDILTNVFPKNSYESYETCLTQIEGVCYKYSKMKPSSGNYLSKAREHMRQNDLRAASLYTRLSFERQLFEIAKNVPIKISFKNKDNISWADLINADIKSKIVSKYSNTNEYKNNLEFDKILKHRYFSSLIHEFPLHQEAHYPHAKRPFFTRDEIKDVIDTVEEFNNYIKKVMDRTDMKVEPDEVSTNA
jgi:DNA repair exonuclease SbcCD ATPase subunit